MANTVVVGGSLEGNVSSCKYEISEIITGRPNFFVITKQSLAVNNCTGENIKNSYWETSVEGGLAIIMFFVILGAFISVASDRL